VQVAYKRDKSTCLGLAIPMEAATNKQEVEEYEERRQKRQKLREEGGSDAAAGAKVSVGVRAV